MPDLKPDSHLDSHSDVQWDDPPNSPLSRGDLILSLAITAVILFIASCLILVFRSLILGVNIDIVGHLKFLMQGVPVTWLDFIFILCVPALVVLLDGMIMIYVPRRHWYEPINHQLARKFSLFDLALFFVVGAVGEELLFRGVLQHFFGFWIATLLFTVIHTRYLKRPLLLAFSFAMGCGLAGIYSVSGKLWVVVLCHFLINMGAMILLKSRLYR